MSLTLLALDVVVLSFAISWLNLHACQKFLMGVAGLKAQLTAPLPSAPSENLDLRKFGCADQKYLFPQ